MFADMPLDNRTVYEFAAFAAIPSFCWLSLPLETSPRLRRLNVSFRLISL